MATTPTNANDYINGSDILLQIGDKAVGHCTDFSVSLSSETKDRVVKPLASAGKSSGMWKGKGVTGLSIGISFSGLRVYTETENGYKEIAPNWGAGTSVTCTVYNREDGVTSPLIKGKFVIDSLEMQTPAGDDVTYNGSLSNDGEPETYPGKPVPA